MEGMQQGCSYTIFKRRSHLSLNAAQAPSSSLEKPLKRLRQVEMKDRMLQDPSIHRVSQGNTGVQRQT